ncbi:MAG: TIGR00725 family protein [Chitinivibrionales bacterium]|nr:TIGR00725 family protein [Chitinivibrionales bacterium]
MTKYPITIGVIGGSEADSKTAHLAYEIGSLIATRGAAMVCGGLGGVMEAAAKGAHESGGLVIGILPGSDKSQANQYIDIIIPTGLGVSRNVLVVQSSDAIIALPGSYGTLSEIAIALTLGKTIVYLPGVWELNKIAAVSAQIFKEASTPIQAVGLALDALAKKEPV